MRLVSVIVPMLNAEDYVQMALKSILQERSVPIEVIVVDDASTDKSRSLVEALADKRIRVIDGPGRGISAGMNVGVAAARGDLIMRCDADDLYPADRIRRQVAWLDDHRAQDALCGAFSTIDPEGRLVARVGRRKSARVESIESELRMGVTRTHFCTFAIRRGVFERVGPFREYFETAEDRDFQLRMGEVCRVSYDPSDTYFYRLHGASITHSRSSKRRVFFDEVAVQFQNQRLSTGCDALMLGKAPAPPAHSRSSESSAALHMHGMLVGQSWRELDEGRVRSSLDSAWRAMLAQPLFHRSWINLAKILYRAIFPK